MIALPGIIDAHTCLWQTVLRGYVPDLWHGTYNTKLLPLRGRYTPDDNFNAAYVGGFEMLSYGTTTVVDYCHNISGPDYAPRSIEALKTTGIRHLFTYSFMTFQPDTFPAGGPVRRRAARLRQLPRSGRPHHHRLRHRFDRRAGSRRAARVRARARGAELHPRQRGRHDRQAECRRPARARTCLVIHGNLISNPELELMAKARMPLCFTPTADTQGTPADVVRRAFDRGVDVVFGCDIPCSIASDTLGQLRVMFNVQGFLDGAMERSFSTVLGRRPAVRPGCRC